MSCKIHSKLTPSGNRVRKSRVLCILPDKRLLDRVDHMNREYSSDSKHKLEKKKSKYKLNKELKPCGTAIINLRTSNYRIPMQMDQTTETFIVSPGDV